MMSIKLMRLILTFLMGTAFWLPSLAYAQIPGQLRHDSESAEQTFEMRCTECHSIETALSSRAYRDWLLGISQRHGKGSGWIPDEDARQIFLHLVVHLEPISKTAAQAKGVSSKKNWRIFISLISGLTAFALLIITVFFGHNKAMRRMWFKGHSYFASAALIAAIIHGIYCFYVFGWD